MTALYIITDEKILRWRELTLIDAGYTLDQSASLAARGDIDLHEACDILRNSGDPCLCFEILW